MNIKKEKKWFTPDEFSITAIGEHNQYRKIESEVKGYINETSGSNKMLYRFKNILLTELDQSVSEIDNLSIDKIAVIYLPFIFSVFNLPFDIATALTVSYLGIKENEISNLQEVERQTIYFEAKQAIMASLMYGSKYMDEALDMVDVNSKFKAFAVQISKVSKAIINSVKNAGDRLSNFFSSVAKMFSSTSDDELEEQYSNILFKIDSLKYSYIGALGKSELFRSYMSNIKIYGKILIDFYYLINFANRTSAYGRQVMFIPQLPNILFEMTGGIPKVYFKGTSEIRLIPEIEFTEDFIYGLAKGIKSKENADVILQYNDDVSLNKAKVETKRQAFKQKLMDGDYLKGAIQADLKKFTILDKAAKEKEIESKQLEYTQKLKEKRQEFGLN